MKDIADGARKQLNKGNSEIEALEKRYLGPVNNKVNKNVFVSHFLST